MEKIWQNNSVVIQDKKDIIHEILKARGVEDPDEFLRITKKKLHNPYKMRGMKKAVKRIIEAIQQQEVIGIFGDYDCDGVSSTALWVLVLRELGAKVIYFVPDRFKDGYGVNKRGLDYFKSEGVMLVITCDTGITAIEEVAYAKSLGMDIIITDHHEPQHADAFTDELYAKGRDIGGFLLPKAKAVIDIKREDCKYPFKSLAGVGVSFKVLCAICNEIHPAGKAGVYQYMDIVALGTLADMMEIVDENRVIVSLGLKMMNQKPNRGIYQLIRANELDGDITSQDVGWTLAPCINAAGRIVSAEQAVEMLIADNKLDAYRFAKELVKINKERKELTKSYVTNIIKSVEIDQEKRPTNIIVTYYPQIPEGIVGLIAGRMMNHFYKPVILLTDSDEPNIIKGSGRSIPKFNMFEALMLQTDRLEGFGGHHSACGLSLSKENFDEFKESMEFYADCMLTPYDLQPKVYIDCIVKGDIIDLDLVKELKKLEPFGNGNHRPVFMMQNVEIIKEKPIGEEKNHLWALIKDGKHTFSTVGFFLYDKYEIIGKPKRVDIAFFPDINEYPKGTFNVQLKLEDIREAM